MKRDGPLTRSVPFHLTLRIRHCFLSLYILTLSLWTLLVAALPKMQTKKEPTQITESVQKKEKGVLVRN